MDLIREDDLDDDSYQRREVYANYGAAMFFAQVLEQGIINALTFAQTAAHPNGTQELFDRHALENSTVTMGRLLERFKPFVGGDVHLVEALQGALRVRNDLAHHYWVKHDKNFFSFTGREIMLAESISAQELFQEVDARVGPVLERYLRSMGITPEQQDAVKQESFDRLRDEAVSLDRDQEESSQQ